MKCYVIPTLCTHSLREFNFWFSLRILPQGPYLVSATYVYCSRKKHIFFRLNLFQCPCIQWAVLWVTSVSLISASFMDIVPAGVHHLIAILTSEAAC